MYPHDYNNLPFIHGVPKHKHIIHVDQMHTGLKLWRVGCGGSMNRVSKPEPLGKLVKNFTEFHDGRLVSNLSFFTWINKLNSRRKLRGDSSYLDNHIDNGYNYASEQQYNNWYLCSNFDYAWEIYDYLIEELKECNSISSASL